MKTKEDYKMIFQSLTAFYFEVFQAMNVHRTNFTVHLCNIVGES